MAVAFDAVSESERTDTSDPMTWTHTPVGTPRGVIVFIAHGTDQTDYVLSVTYGGKGMNKVAVIRDGGGELGHCVAYHLGSNQIPTGAQTVNVDLSSGTTTDLHGVCYTVTADHPTEFIYFDHEKDDVANPQLVMKKGGRVGMSFAMLYTGTDAPGGTLASGNTLGPTMDGGTWSTQSCYETTPDSSDHTIGWSTLATDDTAMIALAVSEVTPKSFAAYDWDGASVTSATSIGTGGFTNDQDKNLWLVRLGISGATDPNVVPPAGWTQIGSTISNTAGNGIWLSLWYYVSGGATEAVDDTFTWTGSRAARLQGSFVSGVDESDIVAVAAVTSGGAAGGLGPSITATGPSTTPIFWAGAFAGAPATTGWQSQFMRKGFQKHTFGNAANQVSMGFWSREEASTDQVWFNPFLFDFNSTTPWVAVLVGLKSRSTGLNYKDDYRTGTTAGTSLTLAMLPAAMFDNSGQYGFSPGDACIAEVMAVSAGDVNFQMSGWTKIGTTDVAAATATTGGVVRASFYKVLAADDIGTPATVTWTGTARANLSIFQWSNGASAGPLDAAVVASATGMGTAPAVTAGASTRKYTGFTADLAYLNGAGSSSQGGFSSGVTTTSGELRHQRATMEGRTGPGQVANAGWTLSVGSPWAIRINGFMSKDEFGSASVTETLGISSTATRILRGVVQFSELLSITTAGRQNSGGAVQLTVTVSISEVVKRLRYASAATNLAFDIESLGVAFVDGTASLALELDITTGLDAAWTLLVAEEASLALASRSEANTLTLTVRTEEELF